MSSFQPTDKYVASSANSRLPASQSHTPKTASSSSNSNWYEAALLSYNTVRQLFHDISGTNNTHIKNDQLAHFNIKGSTFNLRTCATSDGGPIFLQPMPINELQFHLNQKKPWDVFKLDQWNDNYANAWKNIDVAEELSILFAQSLRCSNDEMVEGIIYETNWRTRHPREVFEKLMRFRGSGENWHIDYIIESTTPDSFPHIACFVVDNAPMVELAFSKAEVMCVLALAAGRMNSYAGAHPICPITVFSISGRNLRVIHSYYDPGQSCLVIRKSSQLLNFRTFDRSIAELAMSWMLAKPLPPASVRIGDSFKPAPNSPAKPLMQSPAKENMPFRH